MKTFLLLFITLRWAFCLYISRFFSFDFFFKLFFTREKIEPKGNVFFLVDGDKVVRFQAWRGTELKLSKNNVKFLFRWKKSSENDDRVSRMMRVILFFSAAQGRNGKVLSSAHARQKFFSAEWKTWKRKNVMYELRNFSSWKLNFYGTFSFDGKLFYFVFSIHFLVCQILSHGSADDSMN